MVPVAGGVRDAPTQTTPHALAADWLRRMRDAVASADVDAVLALIAPDGWLRDRLALTWDLRTFRGHEGIGRLLADRLAVSGLDVLELDPGIEATEVDLGAAGRWIQASFLFETATGRGRGVVRLVASPAEPSPLAWTLSLDVRELKGHEEPLGARRPFGVEHGATRSAVNWLDRRTAQQEFADGDPACLVIGAGQSGLAVAARLGQLGVPTLVLERQPRVGDTWRNRYHSLVLHDPIWANHLPYLSYPETWPRFIAKDKLAGWFEAYVGIMELNVWTSATAGPCRYDEATGTWEVPVTRADGSTRVLRPRHLVFATGHSGLPTLPKVDGMDRFGGTVRHASTYRGADGMAGRRVVVVGAGNSSHDICHDLAEAGADVTMVQRSTTYVHSSDSAFEVFLKRVFDQDAPATEDADHLANSFPLPVLFDLHARHFVPRVRELDAELRAGLERAGFRLDASHGLQELYFTRGGGYYIDVGASSAIAEGRIKVRSGVAVERLGEHGVVYSDGSEQEADEVIFATGYGSMREVARAFVGDAVTDRCGPVWGLDDGGELRSVFGWSGHDGLWFAGGNLALVRHLSLTLALQIKAGEEGLLDRHPRDRAG